MSEKTKQKAPKKIWLALLLTVLFGPLGLFYVSWLGAIVLLGVYLGMDSLLPWHTFVKVTFWWVLPTLSALGFSSPKKEQEQTDAKIKEAKVGEAKVGEAKVGEAKVGEAKVGEAKVGEAKVGEAVLDINFNDIKESLAADLRGYAEEAFKQAFDPEQFTAITPWDKITSETLSEKYPAKTTMPTKVRVGDFCHERIKEIQNSELTKNLTHPALISIPHRSGVFFRSPEGKGVKSEDLLQGVALRILSSLPPGLMQIHLIDLQSRGRAFSVLNSLDAKIAPIAPSTPEAVTKFLKEMEVRVAEVTRRCLTRYEWLNDFNSENDEEPEVYHLICLSAYPHSLEEDSIKIIEALMLHSCAARCGIYFFVSSELEADKFPQFESMTYIFTDENKTEIKDDEISTNEGSEISDLMLLPDALPGSADIIVEWLNFCLKGKSNQKKISVSVSESQLWASNAANGVSVPIGKMGRETIFFQLGNDAVVHHALIGGATGTGKTILLHNIILNAAELYSPEDLQMILMDFKEGTEFACYEGLPHMRVLSVASELHFGHNVFEWLVAERMRRAGLFKKVGAANLGDYISNSGVKMPRILVIMDEFQRILSDPNIGSQVSLLLDDIVRTGRSFGINLILSTQSLANVQLESSTLTSVGLRVCMRLSEQEATRFLNYDNSLPTSFNRAGQAVYNDSEGRKEGNKEFQVAFVEVSEIPSRCESLRQREMARFGKRIVDSARVFHGETPVDPSKGLPPPSDDQLTAFIGEPLKLGALPLSVTFEQKDGAHLIAVAQSFDILNTLSNNLAIQFLQRGVAPDIFIVDSFPLAKDRWTWATERGCPLLVTPQATHEALDSLVAELETRKLQETEEVFSPKVLFLIEPQGAKAFPVSTTGEASPAAMKVQALLDQGSRHGIHIILLSSRLTRTDKVLGNFGPLNLQPFSLRIAFKSEEAGNLVYDPTTKTLGNYSGVMSDESNGEITPFQIYDTITN
jgi:S-DNA-T family DNA segregation ATPase FtsK/SpoIIIE